MNANDLWFTARGAGLTAMLMLTVATACGALGSLRLRSLADRVVLQYLHRTAAVLGLLLIAVHVSTLVLDAKAHIGVAGALIPFAARYRPNAVALGSIAAYLLVLVTALGIARVQLAASARAASLWRRLHLLAYPAWAIAVVHGLLAGTDRGQAWMLLLSIACILVIAVLALIRLLSEDAQSGAGRMGSRPARLSG
jgi:DMSO/TMAO reductase YedYZ heme-binding membrane subunit